MIENIDRITVKLHIGNARLVAYVAMLADNNCHPSGYILLLTCCCVTYLLDKCDWTWTEVVQKDCQAHQLNREDAMDYSTWMKVIKDG